MVKISILDPGHVFTISIVASIPLITGMVMSITMASGFSSFVIRKASSPFAASDHLPVLLGLKDMAHTLPHHIVIIDD